MDEYTPGGFDKETSEFELNYWEHFGGVEKFDLHLPTYRRCFPLDRIDFGEERILDIGSGAISVFEGLAPERACITPYDLLANEYNRIAPNKKFMIRDEIEATATFTLITVFNMIDHVLRPEEVLDFVKERLAEDGRVWLAVHLYQPHGEKGHTQNFSFGGIVDLLSKRFFIRRCGVLRESVPHPYLWFGELAFSPDNQSRFSLWTLKAKCGYTYYRLQSVRVFVKLMKIFGMRALLPEAWRF
jgi:hypothetical protein